MATPRAPRAVRTRNPIVVFERPNLKSRDEVYKQEYEAKYNTNPKDTVNTQLSS